MIINPSLPNGNVIFCDDVRYELNGKSTLVGVYGTEMRLFGEAPLMVSELHAVVGLNVDPKSLPLDGVIKIIKSGSEEIVCQQDFEFPDTGEERTDVVFHPEKLQQKYVVLNAHFLIRNVVIEEPCRLKVRAFIGKDEIRLGSLHIWFVSASEMQLPS
jgi:hypothetical protein